MKEMGEMSNKNVRIICKGHFVLLEGFTFDSSADTLAIKYNDETLKKSTEFLIIERYWATNGLHLAIRKEGQVMNTEDGLIIPLNVLENPELYEITVRRKDLDEKEKRNPPEPPKKKEK